MPTKEFTVEIQGSCIDKVKQAGDAVSEVIDTIRTSEFYWPFAYDDGPDEPVKRDGEVLSEATDVLNALYSLQQSVAMIICPVRSNKKEDDNKDRVPF